MLTTAFLLMTIVPADLPAQPKPTTGYAPVNGVKMYNEVHGSGEPVVLLHGAFTPGWLRLMDFSPGENRAAVLTLGAFEDHTEVLPAYRGL